LFGVGVTAAYLRVAENQNQAPEVVDVGEIAFIAIAGVMTYSRLDGILEVFVLGTFVGSR
jgi:hypothetical protein